MDMTLEDRLRAARPAVDETAFDQALLDRVRTLPIDRRRTVPRHADRANLHRSARPPWGWARLLREEGFVVEHRIVRHDAKPSPRGAQALHDLVLRIRGPEERAAHAVRAVVRAPRLVAQQVIGA